MSKRCLQALNNGEQCNAPAVNGTLFCRHHDPQREIELEKEDERKRKERQSRPFALPHFHDKVGVFAAVTAVLNGLSDRVIKRSEAQTYLFGLKFADRLMAEIEQTATCPSALPSEGHLIEPTPFVSDHGQKQPVPFNPARLYRDHASPARLYDSDPATDRLVRELMAQSHEMARNQAKSK